MPTVLVPLDGSDFAERALRPGAALAARAGPGADRGRLVLLACAASDEADVIRRRMQDRAELFAELVDVEVRVVEHHPVDGILRTATELPDALLCMATHGRGGGRTAILGSVSEQVVCHATGPVALVGPSCTITRLPGERGRIVVCSDGSPFGEAVLPTTARLVTQLDLQPWLVEVIGPDEAVAWAGEEHTYSELAGARERLARLSAKIPLDAALVRREVLFGLPAARSIVGFTHHISASLIALATHGLTGVRRLVLGSVSADVVRRAPCPVVVVRPAARRQDDR